MTSSRLKTVHVCRSWLSNSSLGFVGQETYFTCKSLMTNYFIFPPRDLQGSGESDSGAGQATKINY